MREVGEQPQKNLDSHWSYADLNTSICIFTTEYLFVSVFSFTAQVLNGQKTVQVQRLKGH